MSVTANKRVHSSTTSDFDTSASALDSPVFKEDISKSKKKSKSKGKKQKTMTDYLGNKDTSEIKSDNTSIEQKLDEINAKLSNVLTKSDRVFIKDLIKDTVNEMKDQILASVSKRLDILEGEVHIKSVENEAIKTELKSKENEILELKQKTVNLRDKLRDEIKYNEGVANDLEQYSRRNNIRVFGLSDDVAKQTSQITTEKVISVLNEKLSLNLTEADIDIAHRLGSFKLGKHRPTIVKFVRRQTKQNVMSKGRALKNTGVSISHDLTWLNQQVLSSLRLKDRDTVESCWYTEGKLFANFKELASNGKTFIRARQIKHRDFAYWLGLPWPGKH